MVKYFYFNGQQYAEKTVVKIYENKKNNFKFCSYLTFIGHDDKTKLYYFCSLYDCWIQFVMTEEQLKACIEEISTPYVLQVSTAPIMQPDNIDGIVSAWIWYIIIMVFGLFLKEPLNVFGVWILASVIFFTWRHRKMNGGD